MSGVIKVGGVPLVTHTGTDGLVTGMSWGSSVPAGTVLQTVYASASIGYNTASNSFATGGNMTPTASITPASGNDVLIWATIPLADANGNYIYFDLRRAVSGGATTNNLSGEANGLMREGNDTLGNSVTLVFVDASPTADSANVYNIQFRNNDNSTSVTAGDTDALAMIILMEIANVS